MTDIKVNNQKLLALLLFGLISSFLSNRRLRVVLDGKSSILGPTVFLLYINDIPHDVICDIAICADDTTILLSILSVIRHRICSNNLNWLLNLNLIYETLWTGAGSGLLISMLGNLNWFRLTGLITLILLM